jgi:glycosyltransferase involved in cell wall biosynthesis
MSYLIFCSFEVGALPYMMAETLNRHGVKAYYISLAPNGFDHNSTRFHYGETKDDWDLSYLFDKEGSTSNNIKILRDIKSNYSIKCAFATGGKSYLLREAGIDYRYWSFGADLDPWCRFPIVPPQFPLWKKLMLYPYFFLTVCREYRKSIFRATSLMISPYKLRIYQQLCPRKRLFFVSQLIKVMDCYEELCKKKKESEKKICEAVGADRFFFSSARHIWVEKGRSFVHDKGNDIMLHSFERYLKKSNDKKVKLILIRKGPDVGHSEKLIEELGIDNYVVWLNESRRDDLWPYYQGASVCFGQFGTPVVSYGVLEPLANASPCVSFVEDYRTDIPFYKTIPPIFNSIDSEEIANFIYRIVSDEEYASSISYDSWLWAKENCSEEKFVETFLEEMMR